MAIPLIDPLLHCYIATLLHSYIVTLFKNFFQEHQRMVPGSFGHHGIIIR